MLALGHDVFVDFITSFKPLGTIRTWKTSFFCQPQATIKGNPEHDFGVGVILLSTPDFPDGHVRFYVH